VQTDAYQQSQRRLRALKAAYRAKHGSRLHVSEDGAEYNRKFYAALWGHCGPAWGLLEHLDDLAGA